MATRKNSGFASARTESSSSPNNKATVGSGHQTPLVLALKGVSFAPFDGSDEWFEQKLPPGAFDAGLGRVLAEETAARSREYLQSSWLEQVDESTLYASMVTTIVQAKEDGAPPEDLAELHRVNASRVFRAGYITGMGIERSEQDRVDEQKKTAASAAPPSLLGQVLRGKYFSTDDPSSEFIPTLRPGALDIGLARVVALMEGEDGAEMVHKLADDVDSSTMLARHLSSITFALEENDMDYIRGCLVEACARCFLSGVLAMEEVMRERELNQEPDPTEERQAAQLPVTEPEINAQDDSPEPAGRQPGWKPAYREGAEPPTELDLDRIEIESGLIAEALDIRRRDAVAPCEEVAAIQEIPEYQTMLRIHHQDMRDADAEKTRDDVMRMRGFHEAHYALRLFRAGYFSAQDSAKIDRELGAEPSLRPHQADVRLQGPDDYLFRDGERYDKLDPRCLPFVSEGEMAERYWDVPQDGDDLQAAGDRGKRYAAALFLQLARGRDGEHDYLRKVSEHMATSPESRYTQLDFWFYLQRLLRLYGQSISPAAIAADVEAAIREGRESDAESPEETALL